MTDEMNGEREALIRAITSMCHDIDNDKIIITAREGDGPVLRQLLDAIQSGLASLAANAGSEPVAGTNEYGVRGYLAATLKCWHRLTGDEAAELVAMTQRLSGLYTHPSPPEGMVAGWISVDERLPEPRQAVAFVVDSENWATFKYLHGRVLGGSYLPEQGFSVPGLSLMASHWMPLPVPPIPASEAKGG